ncbi:MAG: hypothetical protein ACD_17C00512G0004 [uncultured bacterium]|nr:MAG: hypothetical protein ACD_17C00512G0004 [uncultured bacterium]HBA87490.1 hypothetical protein [Geobacter sp.]
MRVIDFIVADDIRREIGHKVSLMGIYNDTIRIAAPPNASFPIGMRLGLYFRLLLEEQDTIPDNFLVKVFHNDTELGEFGGRIPPVKDEVKVMVFPIVAEQLPIPGEGKLSIQLQMLRGKESLLVAEPPFAIDVKVESSKA